MTGAHRRPKGPKPSEGSAARARSSASFSDDERAAMKEAAQERKVVWGKSRAADEAAVVAKIASLPEPDRSMGMRLHAIISSAAPELSPRLWYGMPAYSKEGDVVCFFQPASKFKARYATLGFSDRARLDDGEIWSISFAVKELTTATEGTITSLVKKAAG